MPHTASVLRPFWLRGLNDISGNVDNPNWLSDLNGTPFANDAGLAGWLAIDSNFIVSNSLQPANFKLSSIDDAQEGLLRAYAFDSCKLGTAAMETLNGIKQDTDTPRSTGWAIVRTYYASFFAAHALLRMFGISCTQLAPLQTTNINKIANQIGLGGNNLQGGFYCCTFDTDNNVLESYKLNASKDGSHGSMWKIFNTLIKDIEKEIDLKGSTLTKNKTIVKKMLTHISSSLTHGDCMHSANWLSSIRNKTNYKQLDGAWFPFKDQKNEYNDIFEITKKWINKPTEIDLIPPDSNEFRGFSYTCTLIVSLYRELAIDMSNRCTTGKSFHHYMPLYYLRQIKVSAI